MTAPTDPYVAVIFSSVRPAVDDDGYDAAAARMEALATTMPGYLGIESARGTDGFGITVSYWRTEDDARAWKRQSEHLAAQVAGRERWYERYRVRVATVAREYSYDAGVASRELLHLAVPADWAEASSAGEYRVSTRGRTLEEEGFIHCAFDEQLVGVANRFYGDVTELILLRIDPRLLDAEVRVEPPADGVDELFPHVYGPIPSSAVVAATPWRRTGDRWTAVP